MKSKKELEQILSQIMDIKIEITIWGNNNENFTFSFEGKNDEAVKKFKKFFGDKVIIDDQVSDPYDEETDMTYIYCKFKK